MRARTRKPDAVGARGQPRIPPRAARFLVLFAICFLLGYGLLLTPFGREADVRICRSLVGISHALIQWGGGHATAEGTLLHSAGGFTVEMRDGCNGVYVTILLWSAMLAFPAPWKMKGWGLAAGTLLIQTLNAVRFISLFYLGQYNMTWFDFVHKYIWESLIILVTMAMFGVWVHRVSPAKAVPDVAH